MKNQVYLKASIIAFVTIVLVMILALVPAAHSYAAGDEAAEEQTQETQEEEKEVVPDGWYKENGAKYYYADGEPVKGLKKIKGYRYYFASNGKMQTGFRKIKGNTFYFIPGSGKAARGIRKIKGKKYYFDRNNAMRTGFIKYKGGKYYFKSSGAMAKGSKLIGKYKYYFNKKNGRMKTGWRKSKGKTYYYDKKGHMVKGVRKINGKKRYFTMKGVYKKNLTPQAKAIWGLTTETGYYIRLNKGQRMVYVLKGSKYNWKRIRSFRCSIGAPGTPTPSGTFKINGKVSHFGENKGYTCWYASAFIGRTYLMHSVVCYMGTKTPSDGRLGMAISHGCVRMKLSSAKWVYDHVPVGTIVKIS